MKNTPMISCPVCGSEFVPVEVYIPDSFFGRPEEILKNEATGKVEFIIGEEMDLEESYTCPICNTALKIKANLSFDVEVDTKETYEEEYVSSFDKPKKIKLAECDLFDND